MSPEDPLNEDREPSIGAAVQDISERAVKLVQDEIELAKAELSEKFNKLLKGTVITAVIAVFLFWMISIALFGFANLANYGFGWNDGQQFWGFFLVAGVLIALSAIGGFAAFKLFKAGSPPVPSKAIEEAQRIKDTLVPSNPEPAPYSAPAASSSASPASTSAPSSALPYDPPVYKGPSFQDEDPSRDRSKPYEQPKPGDDQDTTEEDRAY